MLILYTVTFFVVLPYLCCQLQYSVYFQLLFERDDRSMYQARIRQANTTNEQRVQTSLQFLKALGVELNSNSRSSVKEPKLRFNTARISKNARHQNSKRQFFVAITIITASRKHRQDSYDPRYLTQVSSQLLKLMALESRSARSDYRTNSKLGSFQFKLLLCNVDFHPVLHKEMKSLAEIIPTFARFIGNESMRRPSFSEIFEKEKQDYVFCLKKSLLLETSDGLQPDYVLLLEDDAYPDTNLFPVIKHIIHSHLENRYQMHSVTKSKKSVAYVKFYHPRRLQSYVSLEPDRLPELFGIGMIFGTFLTLIYSYMKPRAYSSALRNSVDFCFLLFVVYSGLVAFAIGRQNIMGFRRLSKHFYTFVPAPHCCTPAMMFPRGNAWRIVDELSEVKCKAGFGKDTALHHFIQHSNLSAFMVSPSLFEHIGMYSMLRQGKLVDPAILP